MPDAIITSTASTFGTITGTFAADQSTITGTVTGIITGTLDGSVGVPGVGVPDGGTTGQVLQKATNTSYDTVWATPSGGAWGTITGTLSNQTDLQTALNLKAPLASPALTGVPTAPTAATLTSTTQLATTAFVQQELLSGTANAKNLEVYVRNQTGATLTAGSIVYINGATGNRPTITLAQANNDANSAQTFGFVKTSIANNGFGYVIVRGELENVDTSALTEGVQLYLSPTTAGTWTTTKPSAPQHLVYVGICVRAHPTLGVILVAVQNGYELDELHDVSITSPTNGQVLKYNSTSGLWVNGTDSAGVAWGGITGTLSSQTDLQTALDGKYSTTNPAGYITSAALTPYLTSATAASTYQTLSGMSSYLTTSAAASTYLTQSNAASTYQTLSGMSSYLTTSTAASTYATKASPTFTGLSVFNNSGNYAISIDNSAGYYTSISSGVYSIVDAAVEVIRLSAGGIKYPDGVTQSVAYPGASGFLLKADNLSGLANTGTARTNLGLGTMAVETASNYLTTASASSTYFTIANAANKADLASPTFTGTPTLPTGTIATTQSPGNNTTAVATTAFVTAAVPAFATETQAIVGTSSTTTISPLTMRHILSNAGYTAHTSLVGNYSSYVSGSASISTLWSNLVGLSVTAANGKVAFLPNSFVSYFPFTSRGKAELNLDWTKPVWFSFRFNYSSAAGIGDSNTVNRVTIGKLSSVFGNLASKGFGVTWTAGTTGAFTVSAHNGTTLTSSASAVTVSNTTYFPTTSAAADFLVYSDGTGNITLFCNGVQVATTTGGPSSGNLVGGRFTFEADNTTSTSGTVALDYTGIRSMYSY